MRSFITIWAGQLVSLSGTSMTRFALSLWAWELTGQATALALATLFSLGPAILISPLAGALVDRWSRKWVLVGSDTAAGMATLALLIIAGQGQIAIWHIYAVVFVQGIADSFQSPAYTASITMMVLADQYERANGMTSFANSTRDIAGPLLAGLLLAVSGLTTILVIDLITFVFAVSTLILVDIPQPEPKEEKKDPLLWDALSGFRYLRDHKGLQVLLGVFFMRNLTNTFAWAVFIPMVLARSGDDTALAGLLESMIGFGGILGAVLVSARPPARSRVRAVIVAMGLRSVLGPLMIGIGAGAPLWAVGSFFGAFFIPLQSAPGTALWQSVVPPDYQGRVFAIRRLAAQVTVPVSLMLVGPTVDAIFEPAMQVGGALTPYVDWLIAPGPGAGMQVMHVLVGIVGFDIALAAALSPALRVLDAGATASLAQRIECSTFRNS